MKNLDLVKECLSVVRGVLFSTGYSHLVEDIEWCLSMIDSHNRYDPGWSNYSIVKALSLMCENYFDCLSYAVEADHHKNELMRSNWHQMADNWCADIKKVSVYLL